MRIDAAGAVTVAGYTESPDFPTSAGAWSSTLGGYRQAFVSRLDPSLPAAQQLVFSTFLGGSSDTRGHAVAVDAAGVVTVAGDTNSADFPTTPGAWDPTFDPRGVYPRDAFVSRLDPSLSGVQQLMYSTFLGASSTDAAFAVAVDAAGVATVAGVAESRDFPVTPGAWATSYGGDIGDGFVTRLDPGLPSAQQLTYSTFLGGGGLDGVNALALDAAGVATVTGSTLSTNFPTTVGAWDRTYNGGTAFGGDAFVTRLDPRLPAAQQLVYSTYLGAAGGRECRQPRGRRQRRGDGGRVHAVERLPDVARRVEPALRRRPRGWLRRTPRPAAARRTAARLLDVPRRVEQ